MSNLKALTQEFFKAASEGGLVGGLSYEEVFSKEDLEKLESDENQDKENFLAGFDYKENTPEYKGVLELWEKGLDQLRGRKLSEHLIEVALKNKTAFEIDWKWTPEDIIWNLKQIQPSVEVELVGSVEELTGKESEVVLKISGQTKKINYDPDQILDFVNKLNEIIPSSNHLLWYDTGGDSYGFILTTKESAKELSRMGLPGYYSAK